MPSSRMQVPGIASINPLTITRLLLGMLLLSVGACGNPTSQRSVKSPSADYEIAMEKRDLGACCATRIDGRVSKPGGEKPADLFHIEGSEEASLRWDSPYALIVEVCDARLIEYRPYLTVDGLARQVTLTVINRKPKPLPTRRYAIWAQAPCFAKLFAGARPAVIA